MIYDQQSDMSEIHAPVEMKVILRSNAKSNGNNDTKSASANSKRDSKNKNYTSASAQRIDISKFTQHLKGVTARKSSQECAKSIRIALESAGARFQSHPVAAADWGGTLMKLGYRKINLSFDKPKEGDIYIINRTGSHVYGHIAGYTGSGWVSDFKQAGYAVYKDSVKYTYYRMTE
ncbi:CHAP domain-containing protein [Acinetobacter shaoyimingii]|uniref:CHAP domain-containing protein n=1 Tax=Acinetobacter shaoyimingii TaxID=2715164 RepID=A0A6G8RSQ5_9GAMM|nr:CHAP domain-containing protein [Acinetobacter shaoyimingii]NHB56532.1 CHAP domain-containing protein [Acinetobacter shaoyimingii]QIO04962.1 CHAP domain-containing protein [Acinetobacter shaoyimingii]